ncbi:uncharacterized protein LOC144553236 [Carex rostrata]
MKPRAVVTMRPRFHLPRKPPQPHSPSDNLPWISPLHYLPPSTSAPPPSPPKPQPEPEPEPPTRYTRSEAAHLISTQSDPQRALDFFNSLSRQPGFSHNHATLSAILIRLAKSRKIHAVDSLLSIIRLHHPCRLYEPPFLSLISLLSSRLSLHQKALDIFLSLPSLLRRKPSPKAVSTFLNLLVESGQLDLVDKLLHHVKIWHVSGVNACICNIVIKHYCKLGAIDKAFELFEEMRRSDSDDTRPNLITYSTLMGGLCKEGKVKEAFQLFEEMIDRDRILPDQLTYNVLIDGFCRQGQMDKAKAVLGFMRSNGCVPNKFNYSALMKGFCKEGKVEEAKQVFDEMHRVGLEKDAVSYTTLVGFLCRNGKVDEGIELVREMNQRGCRPDVVTYNVVIEGLCKEGQVVEAMRLLVSLPDAGVKLNAASYRIVLNCLCGKGEMETAVGLLELMLGRGVVPHFATSNQLLVGLCNTGRMADATGALYGLAEMGFVPETSSWEQLLESVCTHSNKQRCFELINDLAIVE